MNFGVKVVLGLDRNSILTAAHCFHNEKGDRIRYNFKVAVGWFNSSGSKVDIDEDMMKFGTAQFPIDERQGKQKKGEVIIHKDYVYGKDKNHPNKNHPNDIAIIKLFIPIKFNVLSDKNLKGWRNDKTNANSQPAGTFVRPICLPSETKPKQPRKLICWGGEQKNHGTYHGTCKFKNKINQGTKPEKPTNVWVTGYGKKETEEWKKNALTTNEKLENSNELRKVYLHAMSNKTCNGFFKRHEEKNTANKKLRVTDDQICAKASPLTTAAGDSCQGDSGGPLVFEYNPCMTPGIANSDYGRHVTNREKQCSEKKPDDFEKQYQLLGIVSWGLGCGESEGKDINTPGVYTHINEKYVKWIKQYAKNTQEVDEPDFSF